MTETEQRRAPRKTPPAQPAAQASVIDATAALAAALDVTPASLAAIHALARARGDTFERDVDRWLRELLNALGSRLGARLHRVSERAAAAPPPMPVRTPTPGAVEEMDFRRRQAALQQANALRGEATYPVLEQRRPLEIPAELIQPDESAAEAARRLGLLSPDSLRTAVKIPARHPTPRGKP